VFEPGFICPENGFLNPYAQISGRAPVWATVGVVCGDQAVRNCWVIRHRIQAEELPVERAQILHLGVIAEVPEAGVELPVSPELEHPAVVKGTDWAGIDKDDLAAGIDLVRVRGTDLPPADPVERPVPVGIRFTATEVGCTRRKRNPFWLNCGSRQMPDSPRSE